MQSVDTSKISNIKRVLSALALKSVVEVEGNVSLFS